VAVQLPEEVVHAALVVQCCVRCCQDVRHLQQPAALLDMSIPDNWRTVSATPAEAADVCVLQAQADSYAPASWQCVQGDHAGVTLY